VASLPVVSDALVVSPKPREALDWVPRPDALEKTHVALWEYLGLAYYGVTGRA
jgi:uncharacterized SAM-binding protein YcdF (DUF218 family)